MATKKKAEAKAEKPAKAEKASKTEKPAAKAAKADKPVKAAKGAKAKPEKPAKKPAKGARGGVPAPEPEELDEADESEEEESEEEEAAAAEPAPVVVAAPPPPPVAAPVPPPAPVVEAVPPVAAAPVSAAPTRAPVFVPFSMPPPPAPVREPLAVKPSWKTRQVPPDEMPGQTRLDAEVQLSNAVRAHDGTVVGLERKKLSEARLVRVGADGAQTPLSEPGQFSQVAVSTDGKQIFGVRATGKIFAFPLEKDAAAASVCFEGGARIWDFKILNATRAIVSQDRAIHLINTETSPWKRVDSVSVAPVDIPLVDGVDGGRWVVVGRTPRIRLVAVLNDKLLEVQSWAPTEGGVTAVAGRAFLYAPGSVVREEILNLAEVHQTLPALA